MTRRLDRTGDPIEDDGDETGQRAAAGEITGVHDERCRDGWLGHDDEMRPIPCLSCRPNLRTRLHSNDISIR